MCICPTRPFWCHIPSNILVNICSSNGFTLIFSIGSFLSTDCVTAAKLPLPCQSYNVCDFGFNCRASTHSLEMNDSYCQFYWSSSLHPSVFNPMRWRWGQCQYICAVLPHSSYKVLSSQKLLFNFDHGSLWSWTSPWFQYSKMILSGKVLIFVRSRLIDWC